MDKRETMSDAPGRETPPLIDITALLVALWRGKLLIALVLGSFLALALTYVVLTKPAYTATAVLLVDPREPNSTDTGNVLPGIGSDSAAISSQVSVIASRELLLQVFDAEQIASDPEFASPEFIGGLLGQRPTREMVFEQFSKKLTVEREGLTYVINVEFESESPEKAARIVNAIVTRYISGQIDQKIDATARVSDVLETRIDELATEVATAEAAVENFKVEHGIFGSASGPSLLQEQIDQLSVQLLAARERAREAETSYAQAVAAGTTPLGLISLTGTLSSPAAEQLRNDYNSRATQLASEGARLGPRHPTISRLTAEMSELEALMVREVERITAEMAVASETADSVVATIERDLDTLRGNANRDNAAFVGLRQLERAAAASRQVLESFLRRSEETSQLEELQFSNARVITAASAPLRASWPKPMLILAVAGLLGLGAGVSAALLFPGKSLAPFVARMKRPLTRPEPRPRQAAAVPQRRAAPPSRRYAGLS